MVRIKITNPTRRILVAAIEQLKPFEQLVIKHKNTPHKLRVVVTRQQHCRATLNPYYEVFTGTTSELGAVKLYRHPQEFLENIIEHLQLPTDEEPYVPFENEPVDMRP